MSEEHILVQENRAERAKPAIPPKPPKLSNPFSATETVNTTPRLPQPAANGPSNTTLASFQDRYPAVPETGWEWDWESEPHRPGNWVGGEHPRGVSEPGPNVPGEHSRSASDPGPNVAQAAAQEVHPAPRHLSDVSADSAASGASALGSHDRYLTAPHIHAYPPPQASVPQTPPPTACTQASPVSPTTPLPYSPTVTYPTVTYPQRPQAWEQRPTLRLTTPPAPASPRLTTDLLPSPQPVSPSPASASSTKQLPGTPPRPLPETPKRSPTIPGTYTSWMRNISLGSDVQPGPPPPTPTEESQGPPCPHPGGVHAPQVPLSEAHLPAYAQPAPTETDVDAHVHDLVASYETMTFEDSHGRRVSVPHLISVDPFGTSPAFHLTPPPSALLGSPPNPMTPSLLPTQTSANVSLWGSPGLALGSHSPSPSPMLVPPSTPFSHPSSYSQRSASFPSPSGARPTILRPKSTTPLQSPFVSSPNSPYFGPSLPSPRVPGPTVDLGSNPSPSVSPWSLPPDSPDLEPIPLPRTWRCSVCTLSNTSTRCEACGAFAPQWSCTRCTLNNDYPVDECGACGATKIHHSRPVSPQPISPQPLSPTSPTSTVSTTQGKTGEVIEGVGLGFGRVGDTDSDSLPPAASRATPTSTHGSWMCQMCTFGNEPGDKCEMCSAPRP